MTLLETALKLDKEQLDEWVATLTLEEMKELWVQNIEAAQELLDKLAEE